MLFVTGVNGAVGSMVVHHALTNGRPLKAIARRNLYKEQQGISVKCGDLNNLHRFGGFMRGVGDIIHLAASRQEAKDKDIYLDIPIIGRLLDYWKEGCFVFASSQIVYRVAETAGRISEDHVLEASNWYAASKLMSEQMIITQHILNAEKGHTGRYAIFRIPLVAHIEPSGKPQALDMVIQAAMLSKDFCFPYNESESVGYGSSWVGTQDLTRAMLEALQFPESGIYNIASGYVSYIELIEKVIRKTNSRSRIKFNTRGEITLPPYDYHLDTEKLSRTGYTPCEDMEQILDTYLASQIR